MIDPVVRPYSPADRTAVRRICFETGYMGEPVDWQWRDHESFADLFSSYYTDREPGSALVVEVDGAVAGYLLGCVDSSQAWNPASIGLHHILRRGIAFRPGTARVVWRTLTDGALDLARRHVSRDQLEFHDDRWPAHFHIDLLPEARGSGAGSALVRRWLDSLRTQGVAGCYLQTMAENTGAIAFFESSGFTRHGDVVLIPGLRTRTGARLHTQVMVQSL